MTDKEIIKALECCVKNNNCEGCPLDYLTFPSQCASELAVKSLDLINRQQKEVERLKAEEEKYLFKCVMPFNSMICSKSIEDYDRLIGDIGAEAIKEFAERLKLSFFNNGYESPDVDFDYFIDNLVKEMVGEE